MVDPDAEDDASGKLALSFLANPPIVINPEYEGISNDQLVSVANWVHHVPFILPQGRVSWEAPKLVKEEKEEEKEEEDEPEEEIPQEPEAGPTPLTTLSSDEGTCTFIYANSRKWKYLSLVYKGLFKIVSNEILSDYLKIK